MAEKYKYLLKIGNQKFKRPFASPSTYNVTTSTIVDSGRNVDGKVIGAVVREDVVALEVTFNYITVDDWSTILKLFDSSQGGSFYQKVKFYHPTLNTWETRTMYVGDRTSNGLHMLDKNGYPQAWLGAKLSLVEK